MQITFDTPPRTGLGGTRELPLSVTIGVSILWGGALKRMGSRIATVSEIKYG